MSVEDTTDSTPSPNHETTPTTYLFAHQTVPGLFNATYLQPQPAGQDQSRIPFPYVPSNIAGHASLPAMGAFLMPPYCSPLGPFYPGPALPYPFMLPLMATAPVAAAVSSGDSCSDAVSSDGYKMASPRTARTREEGAEKEAVENSDTESMSVAAVAGSSPPASPWCTGPDTTVNQAPTTSNDVVSPRSNDVVSPTSDPTANFSTASVQSAPNQKSLQSKQSKRSLEELLRTDGEDTERSTNSASFWSEVKPNNPQLAHFCQLASRCKLAKSIQIRNLTTEGEVPLTWLEITRRSCHIDANLGPVSVARILISSNGLCKLQLLYPYFKTINTRLMPADDEGVELLLSDLGPQYVLCPGLPDYEQKYDIIGYHIPHVRVMNAGQMKRYDHDNCLLWHVPTNLFSPSGHHLHNMCQHCKYLENKLTKLCGNKDKSQCDKKGAGRSTATPPYDTQHRGQKQRKPSGMSTGARGQEGGSKSSKLLVLS